MRIVKAAAVFAVLVAVLVSCTPMAQEFQRWTAPQATVTGGSAQAVAQAQLEPYNGPKPRVVVARFANKTGTHYQVRYTRGTMTAGDPLGEGMSDQFVTVLMETGRFIVLGSKEDLGDAISEQDYDPTRFNPGTLAAKGGLEAADLLIIGAVTGFKPSQASVGGGAGYVTSGWGSLIAMAVTAAMAQDYVAIDFRAIEARTRRVVWASRVEGTARDFSAGIGGIFSPLLAGVGGSYSTPIDQATRATMVKATEQLWMSLDRGGFIRQWAAQPAPQPAVATVAGPAAPPAPNSAPPQAGTVPIAPAVAPAVPLKAVPAVGAPLAGMVKVKASSAILRDSLNGQRVASVAQGAALKKVAERKVAEHTWVQVEYNEQEVWIRADLVE
ncbi:hypothetical protein HYW67_00220 [Candidatus Parcubacteria bacterium]|nr:hypothetical protein [Candidatus Parcubacteria bacterium]